MNGSGTVSYRHEFFKGDASGAIAHSIRSLEQDEGVFRQHSNNMIDPQRTVANEVFYFENGQAKTFTGTAEIYERVKARQDERASTKKLRSNQVAFCETIFQLDPEFTGSSADYINGSNVVHGVYMRRLMMEAAKHITETVGGEENVVYIAMHLDEANPHFHIGWVPLAGDGALDYRKVLGGVKKDKTGRERGNYTPKKMSEEHDRLHAMLGAHGYQVVRLNGQRKHQTVAEFKRDQDEKKQRAEEVAALESERQELLNELAGREADADEFFKQAEEFGFQEGFQQGFQHGRRSVEREEKRLEEDRERLDAWRSKLEEQNRQIQQQAQAQARNVQRMKQAAKKLEQNAKMKAQQIIDAAETQAAAMLSDAKTELEKINLQKKEALGITARQNVLMDSQVRQELFTENFLDAKHALTTLGIDFLQSRPDVVSDYEAFRQSAIANYRPNQKQKRRHEFAAERRHRERQQQKQQGVGMDF